MPDYSTEALKRGIESAKVNIQTFENAITKERNTISEYYGMIETIQRKQREANVNPN